MASIVTNERKLKMYLLGELSDDEQAEIEERYVVNGDFFERLVEVEDKLIHKYVRNELSRNDQKHFEKYFLSVPLNREKVKLAQSLILYLAKEQEQPVKTGLLKKSSAWLDSFATLLIPGKPALQLVPVLGLIFLAVLSAKLTFETRDLNEQVTRYETERSKLLEKEQNLQQQVDSQRVQHDELIEQLQNEKNRSEELERRLSEQSRQKREFFTMALQPGISRGTQNRNELKRTEIDPSEQAIKLQLPIGNAEAFEHYRVVIETASGDTVLSHYKLQAQQIDRRRAIVLLLPIDALDYDDYLITLYGVLSSQEIEYIDGYSFNFAKD